MRGKSLSLYFFFLLVFYSCSTIKYKDMASSDPGKLIALRDSLNKELSPELIDAFIEAYNKVGIQAYNLGNYEKSIGMFLNSQELSIGDTLSRYYLLMASGKKSMKVEKRSFYGNLYKTFIKLQHYIPK